VSQRDVVRREFSRQAASFDAAGSLFRDTSILDWIASHVTITQGARIVDVAGGTGQLGRYLAGDASTVVIVDLTEAMLATGLRSALEDGCDNVVFVRGDATALPFPDAEFDVVVSRFALHHIEDPAAAVTEMARVCRADGSVTLIDMLAGGLRHDELERLRDPSHAQALTQDQLEAFLTAAGRAPRRAAQHEQTLPVDRWLAQAQTHDLSRETIRDALIAEADGGPATGLRSARSDDQLTITQRWLLIGD
jgi:ubiquinone/menaquinone biosynthesis C-methylase UbiE